MLPSVIHPMLAQSALQPFDSAEHLFEIKWDGIRAMAFISSGQLRLQSRGLLDITSQFPELESLRRLPTGTVIDGEVVIFEADGPSLARVQQRVHARHLRSIRPSVRAQQVHHELHLGATTRFPT
jgi:ATP-dependent DNA ligase